MIKRRKEKKIDVSKSQVALTLLVLEILNTPLGSKMKTFDQLSEDFKAVRGTIQNAYKYLRDIKAITIQSKGRLGLILIDKDYQLLLGLIDKKSIQVAVPFPYCDDLIGMNISIKEVLEKKLECPVHFIHAKYATQRIKELEDKRADLVVVSRYYAKMCIEQGKEFAILMEFNNDYFNMDLDSLKDAKVAKNILKNTPQVKLDIQGPVRMEEVTDYLVELESVSVGKKPTSIEDPLYLDLAFPVLLCRSEDTYFRLLVEDYFDINEMRQINKDVVSGKKENVMY